MTTERIYLPRLFILFGSMLFYSLLLRTGVEIGWLSARPQKVYSDLFFAVVFMALVLLIFRYYYLLILRYFFAVLIAGLVISLLLNGMNDTSVPKSILYFETCSAVLTLAILPIFSIWESRATFLLLPATIYKAYWACTVFFICFCQIGYNIDSSPGNEMTTAVLVAIELATLAAIASLFLKTDYQKRDRVLLTTTLLMSAMLNLDWVRYFGSGSLSAIQEIVTLPLLPGFALYVFGSILCVKSVFSKKA